MKSRSIVRRLIITILLMELVSVIALSTVALLHERRERFTAFDVTLRGHADSLLGAIQEDEHDNLVIDKTGLNLPPRDVFHVQDETGAIIGQSPNWGDGPSSRTQEHRRDPHSPEGFFSLILNGQHFRAIRTSATRVIDPDEQGGERHRFTIIYAAPTHRLWHGILEEVAFYTIASLLLLAATGITMVWLLNRGMSPLREIATKASTVSATSWTFEPSEEVLSTKELGPLARTLQTVLKDLEYSFTQQRRFVSDAAHELKTAVAVVQSSIQVLALKPRTVEEYQHGLDQCHADSVRMEEIVGKMLTLARVESEPSPQKPAPQTDLSESLRRTADQLASVAQVSGVTIQLPPRLDPSPVQLSPQDAEVLCSNLLLNSIQHSNPGSQITAAVTKHETSIELKIEDQGEGIDPEALPFIFERFYRSDPSRNRQTGGTGLGLAICRAIVEAAQGQITMTSTPHVGTTATVTLPSAPEA